MGQRSAAELERIRKMIERNYRHGHCSRSPSRTWKSWRAMFARCYNPHHAAYPRYGGNGIGVCPKWFDFVQFLSDMGERPDNMTLDRINNFKGYSPQNCRWATRKEQARNMRNNVWIEHRGLRLTQAEWSRRIGVGVTTICWRRQHGWPTERILNNYVPPA